MLRSVHLFVSVQLHYAVKHGRRKRGGRVPAVEKSAGDVPPRNDYILGSFILDTDENFAFSTISKIKCPKSEEKLNFGGRWVGCL